MAGRDLIAVTDDLTRWETLTNFRGLKPYSIVPSFARHDQPVVNGPCSLLPFSLDICEDIECLRQSAIIRYGGDGPRLPVVSRNDGGKSARVFVDFEKAPLAKAVDWMRKKRCYEALYAGCPRSWGARLGDDEIATAPDASW